MDTTLQIVSDQTFAISVKNVTFEWVTKMEAPVEAKKNEKQAESVDEEKSEPFKISGLDMSIPRGSLVAICGPVGSGSESIPLSPPMD